MQMREFLGILWEEWELICERGGKYNKSRTSKLKEETQ